MEAIQTFEDCSDRITAQACRANAERFSEARFEQEMRQFVELRLSASRQARQSMQFRATQIQPSLVAPTLVASELSARVVPIKSV
jgi:regulator of PEP synthase PpsR (kinase-PPPase family)